MERLRMTIATAWEQTWNGEWNRGKTGEMELNLHGIVGFVPIINAEAKGIILVLYAAYEGCIWSWKRCYRGTGCCHRRQNIGWGRIIDCIGCVCVYAVQLSLRSLIGPDMFARAIKSASHSSARRCRDKAIIAMTHWSELPCILLIFRSFKM